MDVDELRGTAAAGIRALITLAGEDPDRGGLVDTPRRVIDAVLEMTSRPGDPGALLAKVFDDAGSVDEMVTVGPVEFTSLCEHHLLPFTGRAWVAYIASNGTVVGLSKLARLVEHHARALQVQERLTGAIVDDLVEHLRPVGAGVKIAAVHSCMSVRGVRKPGAMMTTIALRGALLDKPAARAEFLSTTGGNGD